MSAWWNAHWYLYALLMHQVSRHQLWAEMKCARLLTCTKSNIELNEVIRGRIINYNSRNKQLWWIVNFRETRTACTFHLIYAVRPLDNSMQFWPLIDWSIRVAISIQSLSSRSILHYTTQTNHSSAHSNEDCLSFHLLFVKCIRDNIWCMTIAYHTTQKLMHFNTQITFS